MNHLKPILRNRRSDYGSRIMVREIESLDLNQEHGLMCQMHMQCSKGKTAVEFNRFQVQIFLQLCSYLNFAISCGVFTRSNPNRKTINVRKYKICFLPCNFGLPGVLTGLGAMHHVLSTGCLHITKETAFNKF